LRELFRVLDSDASNKLSIREFKAALEAFNETTTNPLTQSQIEQLMEVAPKSDGLIDYELFLTSFQIVML